MKRTESLCPYRRTIRHLIVFIYLISLISCNYDRDMSSPSRLVSLGLESCAPEHVLRCAPRPDIRTADLPSSWQDLGDIELVSQGCFDGRWSFRISQLSDEFNSYLKSRYSHIGSSSTAMKKHVLENREHSLEYLEQNFEVIDHPWAKKLNLLTHDLISFIPGNYAGLDLTVSVVRNKDGTPYNNASTLPGVIIFGERFLDDILKLPDQQGLFSVITVLSHEIGHQLLDIGQSDLRKYALIKESRSKYGQFGELIASISLKTVQEPFQKRYEIIADHFAILLMAETKRVDMIDALAVYRNYASITEKELEDSYYSDLLESHPGPINRSHCLNHLIINHLIK